MARFPTMPLRTDALLGDTGHLSACEFGAYTLLLIAMWRNGAWLPNDERLLAKYARLDGRQWKRSRGVLLAFFNIEGDRVTQNKVTEEWELALARSEQATDAIRSRWEKEKGSTRPASRTRSASMTAEHGREHDSPSAKSLKSQEPQDTDVIRPKAPRNTIQNPESIKGGGGRAHAPAREADLDDDAPFGAPKRDQQEPEVLARASLRDRLLDVAGVDISKSRNPARWLGSESINTIEQWQDLGLSSDEIVETVHEVMLGKTDGPPKTLSYFTEAMQRRAGRKQAPALTPIDSPAPQQRRTRADDRFARIASRFRDDREGRAQAEQEVAGDQSDDLPRPLLPPRAVRG